LSRPGGKYILVGVKFGKNGNIEQEDLVSDAVFDQLPQQKTANNILDIALNPLFPCKAIDNYGDWYYGEVD